MVKGKSSCEGTCGPRVCSVTSVDSDDDGPVTTAVVLKVSGRPLGPSVKTMKCRTNAQSSATSEN